MRIKRYIMAIPIEPTEEEIEKESVRKGTDRIWLSMLSECISDRKRVV